MRDLIADEQDVVLDFSFWSRAMREDWRRAVEECGIVPETSYLATDRATCFARVAARARAHGDDFSVDVATVAACFDQFEPPTPDEGPMSTVVT